MADSVKNTPIVQYSDSEGNRAYAYTHWEAIDGKPEKLFLTSPNGTRFIVSVDDDGNLKATKEVSDGNKK
ncbi:hypothetical protein [Leuconostoc citreum]|uniref:hypothetical protein n=1 Tax=Leuconostoc citreum TaxID=33964 RepID=UPI0015DA96E4|nr:hypothetical protein [Leuconostoc citreum]